MDRADGVGVLGSANAAESGGCIYAAAVAPYRASVREGRPLSERKLAEAFGKPSRRWARKRMAEARQILLPAQGYGHSRILRLRGLYLDASAVMAGRLRPAEEWRSCRQS
jgi:hypothetical protein